MSKATLRFDLSDPDDKEDFRIHTKAKDMLSVLHELSAMFRNIDKYESYRGDTITNPDALEFGRKLRTRFTDLLIDADLSGDVI